MHMLWETGSNCAHFFLWFNKSPHSGINQEYYCLKRFLHRRWGKVPASIGHCMHTLVALAVLKETSQMLWCSLWAKKQTRCVYGDIVQTHIATFQAKETRCLLSGIEIISHWVVKIFTYIMDCHPLCGFKQISWLVHTCLVHKVSVHVLS